MVISEPARSVRRAIRIHRVVEYLYATGRLEWGHAWAAEWHKLASRLRENYNINIYH